jgi:hypothetical protein
MAKLRGAQYKGWNNWVECIACSLPQPQGKYSDVPIHLTCRNDEAGKKKIAVWKREQKKLAKSEVPRLI